MKFIFNDTFITDPNLFHTKTDERSVFVSGNLIFEKSSVAASGKVSKLISEYKSADGDDKLKIASDVTNRSGRASGWTDDDAKDFFKGISASDSGGRSFDSSGKSMTRQYLDTIVGDTDDLGQAADEFGAKQTLRERVVDQLKPFMSNEEIGKAFDDLWNKAGLAESEVLDFFYNIIDLSAEAGSNIKELINFATMHYSTRRDKGLTLLLLDLGSKLQKKYPEVNFFAMMIDSANGEKPKLGKLAIITDKTDMDSARKIFSLSQHRIVEQNAALNRERKEVRDRVQNMQERTNLQRAIFEAMKMNEVERGLIIELDKFGETFRRLVTNPQFRALKDLQYTILAGRRLLDAWMSLYVDKQPVTPSRSTDETRDDPKSISTYTGKQQGRSLSDLPSRSKILTSSSVRFVKVAQNTQNNNAILEVQRKLLNDLIQGFTGRALPKISNGNLPDPVKKLLSNHINNLVSEFSRALRLNQRVSFSEIYDRVLSKTQTSITSQRRTNSSYSNFKVVVSQQGGAQINRPAVTPDFQDASNLIGVIVNAVYYLGSAESIFRIFTTGDLTDVVALYRMIAVYESNLFLQLDNQLGNVGIKSPLDNSLFSGGKVSAQGARMMMNEQEADAIIKLFGEEAFAVERLETKIKADEQILSNAENNLSIEASQSVQLSEGKETIEGDKAPLEFPAELKQKYESFVNQVNTVIKSLYYVLGIRRNMKKRAEVEGSDPLIMNTLSRIEQDLLIRIKRLEETRDKYKSTNLIRIELEKIRRLKELLGPLEAQIKLFSDAGISIASLITQPNGLLNTISKIRDEEENALDKLIDKYTELKERITPVNLGNFQRPTFTQATGQVEIGEPQQPSAEMI